MKAALAVLLAFAVPRDSGDLSVIQGAEDFDVPDFVAMLVQEHLLLRAGDAETNASALCMQLIRDAVRMSIAVGIDIGGFGATATDVAPDLASRLMGVVASLAEISARFQTQRVAYVAAQQARLATQPSSLHIGGGAQHLDGWVSVDLPPAELALDVRWGLPFEAASVQRCYMSHVLEHLPQLDARALLREVLRVLAPGGRVRIVVPHFRRYAEAYVTRDAAFFATQSEHWPWAADMKTDLERILRYAAGSDPSPWSFTTPHRYGYDFETLRAELQDVGFVLVDESSYMGSDDRELRVDDRSSFAHVHHQGVPLSLFVEARK
ncbi:MAG: methyltransferase domain-containing protein [Kofleriaceae bacterium]